VRANCGTARATRGESFFEVSLMTKPVVFASLSVFLAGILILGGAPAGAQPQKPSTQKGPADEKPKFKAIWEPVNYKQDIKLTDVVFVSEQVGWVSGASGTLLKTTDGGDSWTAVLGGDATAKDDPIETLRFAGENHGWAVKGTGKLLRTTDGANWEEFGRIGAEYGYYYDYAFVSPTNGVQIVKEKEYLAQTGDGGKTWKTVLPGCTVQLEIDGLSRTVKCSPRSFFFLSPAVGFAVGAATAPTGGATPGKALVVLKTDDGGTTWKTLSVVPDVAHEHESHFWQGVVFTDENTGFVIMPRGSKFLGTSDGGKTWRGVIANVKGKLKFAGPVGWSFEGNKLTYTTDGGKRWTTAALRFPAGVNAFSLPSPQRGYVVGDHGMIYRYRIVPIDYTAKGILDAPVMPARAP
jgi:photosystem II stability/assembly factor-like uncharacterized protein